MGDGKSEQRANRVNFKGEDRMNGKAKWQDEPYQLRTSIRTHPSRRDDVLSHLSLLLNIATAWCWWRVTSVAEYWCTIDTANVQEATKALETHQSLVGVDDISR